MSEEEDTEWTDYIQKILQSDVKAYKKTPEDFEEDMSRYEHGFTGHVYFVLLNVLKQLRVFYTKSEMIWEVYRATSELIPYRDKHDTIHDRMPWLLYQASVIVGKNYDEDEMHAMTDQREDNGFKVEDDDEDEENALAAMIEAEEDLEDEYYEDASSYNSGYDSFYADDDFEMNSDIEENASTTQSQNTSSTHRFDFGDYEEDASSYNTEYSDYSDEE
ncbi:MAG: hypothetical protein II229_00500 [Clostridia bacterium]|nr:hypothetical protein [Clostridia bacterium]